MVVFKEVHFYYESFHALKGISFEVPKGSITAFLGPNGAGKSTSMRILSGLFPPREGHVEVNGISLLEAPKAYKSQIGYLPEKAPLIEELNVQEYLHFAADLRGVPKTLRKERVHMAMERFRLMERRQSLIGSLSKGFRQRVGLAQSILHYPPLLVLDEPTVGLEPQQILEFRESMQELSREQGMTILLSTHLLEEAQKLCDRAVMISEGRIVLSEGMDQIKQTDTIVIRVEDTKAFLKAIEQAYPELGHKHSADGQIELALAPKERTAVAKIAAQCGLLELREARLSLEEAFFQKTYGIQADSAKTDPVKTDPEG